MKRLWRILKKLGLAVLALVVLLLLTNAVLIWITGSRLEARLQAIRDAKEPVGLHDLVREPIPADKNAATFLSRAKADISAVWKELMPVYDRLDKQNDIRTEADNKAIRAALEAYPALFPLLEQAVACADYQDNVVDYTNGPDLFLKTLIEQTQHIRPAVPLLQERVRLQIADGKRDDALQSALVILRLARFQEREPATIGYLTSIAIRTGGLESANRVLRSGPVSAKARKDLDAELVLADSSAAYESCLKTERVFGQEIFRNFPWQVVNWLTLAKWNDEKCFHIDLLGNYLTNASRSYSEAHRNQAEFQEENKSSWRHVLCSTLLPVSLEHVHEATIRSRALVRCLRVLNAFQQKEAIAGAAQFKLEELGLPAEAIVDPYTGSNLHLRQVGGEWIIYAVGKDLTDDGGTLKDYKDVGIGPIAAGQGP